MLLLKVSSVLALFDCNIIQSKDTIVFNASIISITDPSEISKLWVGNQIFIYSGMEKAIQSPKLSQMLVTVFSMS